MVRSAGGCKVTRVTVLSERQRKTLRNSVENKMARVEIDVGGVQAVLVELKQNGTYEGLIEGLPNRTMNERKLQILRQQKIHVVYAPELPSPGPEDYPFGKPARLGRICCIARLGISDSEHVWEGKFVPSKVATSQSEGPHA